MKLRRAVRSFLERNPHVVPEGYTTTHDPIFCNYPNDEVRCAQCGRVIGRRQFYTRLWFNRPGCYGRGKDFCHHCVSISDGEKWKHPD